MNTTTMNHPEIDENIIIYERFDSAYGIVTGTCRTGAYLQLDNGEIAFAYKFASLRPGTKVLCSIQKLSDGNRYTRVSVDSVLSYPTLKAS